MKKKLEYKELGNTGLIVSELCFGALPMGPLQARLSPEEGGALLREAYAEGVNFVDTAQLYRTYPHVRESLKGLREEEVIIASKSVHNDYEGMESAILECLEELGRSYIDIFHLHAAKSRADVFQEKAGAFQCLLDYKAMGKVRAVGISSHNVEVIRLAATVPEIDVVYPIINRIGLGIINGGVTEMREAIRLCKENGKGLYAMKVLAGGNLLYDYRQAMEYARSIEEMDSISMGMIHSRELAMNLAFFRNEEIPEGSLPEYKDTKKMVVLQNICKKCGKCIKVCPNEAIFIENDTVKIDESKCLLCGYCYPACPEFGIRMI